MCGISGYVGFDNNQIIEKMNSALFHRGPNDFGVFCDKSFDVVLGMRRLSILDLAGGHQPMSDPEENAWIVFNGEIFNSPELRMVLEKQGRRFKSNNSDTEVLLQLYEVKKEKMLEDLNGMFSFVLFDKRNKLLFGARDRFGIKPFYYTRIGGRFCFSSESKAILACPGLKREIDRQSLFHFMSLGYIPGEQSIFKNIKRLRPGHYFTLDLSNHNFSVNRFYQVKFKPDNSLNRMNCGEYIRSELSDAVSRWALSDVDIACSLSGGLDSSAIVSLLAQQKKKIKTYSLGFDVPEAAKLNELPLARKVAQKYGTDHHELIIKPQDLIRDLPAMAWHLDEPYGGGLPSWKVFQFMAKDVKVGLTGTGGDEIFGNYEKYAPLERNMFARWRIRRSIRPFKEHYFDRFYYLSDEVKKKDVFIENGENIKETSSYYYDHFLSWPDNDLRNSLSSLDFETQLPDEFLLMTDRFSMAHSLEARVPFLDHEFVEKMLRIPSNIRMRRGDPKYLLREALEPLLPLDLLKAEKRGFVLPIAHWLRNELKPVAEFLLAPERLKKQDIFKWEYFPHLLRQHSSYQQDHHLQLWFAFMFQLWHLIFIEENMLVKPTWELSELC